MHNNPAFCQLLGLDKTSGSGGACSLAGYQAVISFDVKNERVLYLLLRNVKGRTIEAIELTLTLGYSGEGCIC